MRGSRHLRIRVIAINCPPSPLSQCLSVYCTLFSGPQTSASTSSNSAAAMHKCRVGDVDPGFNAPNPPAAFHHPTSNIHHQLIPSSIVSISLSPSKPTLSPRTSTCLSRIDRDGGSRASFGRYGFYGHRGEPGAAARQRHILMHPPTQPSKIEDRRKPYEESRIEK